MKYTFITLLSTLVFFIGCGLMGTSKGESEEPEQIHVPQKISVEIPDILKKTTTNTQTKKTNWYH